ncbi:MAG: type II toxin-antitoxin system VapC family toxin [Acidobacteria bacterium]|nr:type II toxin-antitoxin system VapC family toxin [Acidobacteriota bacterium]
MILYLDTSSLVKLYVDEIGSSDVCALVDRADVVSTSMVALPEARSAFARLAREEVLSAQELDSVRKAFLGDWDSFLKVRMVQRLCRRAGDLAEDYALRGFDALHLASFLEILEQSEDERVEFSAFDARLNAAAAQVVKDGG